MTSVQGTTEPAFAPVRDVFERSVEQGRDVGAGVCVFHHGRPVVDLLGGSFDREGTIPYDESTLQLVFSTTKGIAAIAVGILVDRGLLDPDAPVAEYWPEFAAEGKGAITVTQALSHQAGLFTVEPALTIDDLLDWDTVTTALAAQAPLWEPGTTHGYHALTYGWLAGELVRRASGLGFGDFVQAEISQPLGVDLWVGLPEEHEGRVSPLIAAPPPPPDLLEVMLAVMGPGTMGWRALTMSGAMPFGPDESPFNTRAVHAAEWPAASAVTNARSLARVYAATFGEVDGVRLLSPEYVDRARARQVQGPDACLAITTSFGLGFMLHEPFTPMLGDGSFGHPGAGGSLGFADPESGIAFGYVMNKMESGISGDPRVVELVEAVASVVRA